MPSRADCADIQQLLAEIGFEQLLLAAEQAVEGDGFVCVFDGVRGESASSRTEPSSPILTLQDVWQPVGIVDPHPLKRHLVDIKPLWPHLFGGKREQK